MAITAVVAAVRSEPQLPSGPGCWTGHLRTGRTRVEWPGLTDGVVNAAYDERRSR